MPLFSGTLLEGNHYFLQLSYFYVACRTTPTDDKIFLQSPQDALCGVLDWVVCACCLRLQSQSDEVNKALHSFLYLQEWIDTLQGAGLVGLQSISLMLTHIENVSVRSRLVRASSIFTEIASMLFASQHINFYQHVRQGRWPATKLRAFFSASVKACCSYDPRDLLKKWNLACGSAIMIGFRSYYLLGPR